MCWGEGGGGAGGGSRREGSAGGHDGGGVTPIQASRFIFTIPDTARPACLPACARSLAAPGPRHPHLQRKKTTPSPRSRRPAFIRPAASRPPPPLALAFAFAFFAPPRARAARGRVAPQSAGAGREGRVTRRASGQVPRPWSPVKSFCRLSWSAVTWRELISPRGGLHPAPTTLVSF